MTKLIVFDEAPMMHKWLYAALDKLLKDLRGVDNPAMEKLPFGGVTMLLAGDFRQVLPVIPKAGRSAIISASLKRHPIWHQLKKRRLTINMRVETLKAAGKQLISSSPQDHKLY